MGVYSIKESHSMQITKCRGCTCKVSFSSVVRNGNNEVFAGLTK